MSDLIGFNTILLVCLITLLISLRWPDVSKIIIVALIFRILIMLVGYYIIPLPDSGQDAVGFENLAWIWAQNGFFNTLSNFPGINSFFYPWIIALIYSLFGRSILMIQSIGLLFGIGSVFLGWLLAKKLWDYRSAKKAGWLLALFPPLALYSITPLREVYSSFFLLVAMIGVVNWTKNGGYKSIFLAVLGFIGATFFHGVLMIGGMIFFIIVGFSSFFKSYKLLMAKRVSIQASLFIFLIITFFGIFYLNKINIPYIGTFDQSTNMGWLIDNIKFRMKGDASYPAWTIINSPVEFIYKGLARVVFFLFSPFPWEIKELFHLFGLFDAFLYIILIYLIFINRKVIWNDPALRTILIILLCYFFIFGLGTSNFGAGLRHRSKFAIELIILAAPLIPNLILYNNKKLRKYLSKF